MSAVVEENGAWRESHKTFLPELSDKPIEDLELSVRVYNSLKRAGISTIGDLMEMIDKNGGSLMNLRNFGEKSMLELKDKLKSRGVDSGRRRRNADVKAGSDAFGRQTRFDMRHKVAGFKLGRSTAQRTCAAPQPGDGADRSWPDSDD